MNLGTSEVPGVDQLAVPKGTPGAIEIPPGSGNYFLPNEGEEFFSKYGMYVAIALAVYFIFIKD